MAEKATDILIAHAFLYLRDFDGALATAFLPIDKHAGCWYDFYNSFIWRNKRMPCETIRSAAAAAATVTVLATRRCC
jgi:hypothetical protein